MNFIELTSKNGKIWINIKQINALTPDGGETIILLSSHKIIVQESLKTVFGKINDATTSDF